MHPYSTPVLLLLVACALGGCDEADPGAAHPTDDGQPVDQAAGPAATPVDAAAFEAARNEAFRLFDAGGDLGAMREALEAARDLDPSAYGVNWRLGQVLADLKLHSEALACFQAAWEARPDETSLLLKIVTLQAQLGLDEQALLLLPRLHDDPALAGEALYLEARIRDMAGDRDMAVDLVRRADALPPSLGFRGQSLYGRFLMQDGQMQSAYEHFAKALEGRADYKEALKGLADTCRRLGREDDAAHWDEVLALVLDLTDDAYARQKKDMRRTKLERLVMIHPAWDGAFKQLADLQRRAGDMDAACATIDAFLSHHGDSVPEVDREALRRRYCTGRDP